MAEEVGKVIGSKIGQVLELDKWYWQDEQAKFIRIKVKLPIDKPLRRGGTSLMRKEEEVGLYLSTNGFQHSASIVEYLGMITDTAMKAWKGNGQTLSMVNGLKQGV